MKSLFFLLFFFPVLLAAAQTEPDTSKTKKKISISHKYFSRCDHEYFPDEVTVPSYPSNSPQVTVKYYCFNHTLFAVDEKGKELWKIDTEKELGSKYLKEIYEWPYYKKYDVFIKMEDGSCWMLKSKSGKRKKVNELDVHKPGKF